MEEGEVVVVVVEGEVKEDVEGSKLLLFPSLPSSANNHDTNFDPSLTRKRCTYLHSERTFHRVERVLLTEGKLSRAWGDSGWWVPAMESGANFSYLRSECDYPKKWNS